MILLHSDFGPSPMPPCLRKGECLRRSFAKDLDAAPIFGAP